MAGPTPELVFEIFGLEAWEFVIGNEERTKLLFAMRDSRNFVAWYFYSERLSFELPFEEAALLGRKFDKERQLGTQGRSASVLKPRDPIRVDKIGHPGRAFILEAKRTKDELVVRLRLRRTEKLAFDFDVIFDAAGYDKPTDIAFPMLGSVVLVDKVVRHKGPIKLPQGFDAARMF